MVLPSERFNQHRKQLVSSLLWMRRERRGVVPLKPLCLGNLAARAKLRGLQSTMDEEREEGAPLSKTTLSGEHVHQSKAKSPEQQERADSPGPSCVSVKSNHFMGRPPDLKDGCPSSEEGRVQQEKEDTPGPSCVSMKSHWSMEEPPDLKDGRPSREERRPQERSKVTSDQSVMSRIEQNQAELIKRAEVNAHAFLDK
ncbi:unnamed protein product [Gadus morhua 'NCC']